MIDFIRLKASSICHRDRYNSRTCFRVQADGSVVQAKKYCAASSDISVTVVCFLLACCLSFFLAYSVACRLRWTISSLPLIGVLLSWWTHAAHSIFRLVLVVTTRALVVRPAA